MKRTSIEPPEQWVFWRDCLRLEGNVLAVECRCCSKFSVWIHEDDIASSKGLCLYCFRRLMGPSV